MKRFAHARTWAGTLAVGLFFWLAVTACDSSYEVIVDEVSIAKGTASGKLRINGRSREFSGVADGEEISIELDGFKFKGKLKRGSQFTIKQGGLIVVQVPDGIVAGDWIAINDLTGDTARVALGTTRPARFLDSSVAEFVAEPGHHLLYGRLPRSFRDADWSGSLTGTFGFDGRSLGRRTFKMLIAGIVTVIEPGATVPIEYIFPEFPMDYDFAAVTTPRNRFEAYLLDGTWSMLSAREALALGLPGVATTQYISLELDGAVESELASRFTLERGGRSVSGDITGKGAHIGRGTAIIGFDRDAFFGVVDSTRARQVATLSGSVAALPTPNVFAFDATLTLASTSGVGISSSTGSSLSVDPNPVTASDLRVTYRAMRQGDVKLALVDALGRVVASQRQDDRAIGVHETTIDVSQIAPGSYTLTVSGAARASLRVVIVR